MAAAAAGAARIAAFAASAAVLVGRLERHTLP